MNETKELSAPAAAVQRTTEAGHGCLSVGRPWVQFEGWMLKESGALTGGWHLRYLVVNNDSIEYYREEKVKLEIKSGETAGTILGTLGFDVDGINIGDYPGFAAPSTQRDSLNGI